MPGQQRGRRNPSTRGDFTGNKKEALQREHAEQLEERRAEIGLINAGKAALKDEGVIDLMSGTPLLDHPDAPPIGSAEALTVVDDEAGESTPASRPQPETPQGTRLDGGGKATIDIYELPEERSQATLQAGEAMTEELMNEPVLIKSMYDLEDTTIGYGNTYTFREGIRYRVPRWVAVHLEEKQLCIVLSLNPV